MADNARGVHVSPGVYSREIDMTYAVKSLGITTLGLAGETLRGPAFQPMHIENWRDFVSTFGGSSTEKFKGSLYPKYELPYIAKSYLTESKQLEVVRVLGLSGYNAGPAWVVTVKLSGGTNMAVCVLRSRGKYYKYRKFDANTGTCECPNESYDSLVYDVGEVKMVPDNCDKPVAYNGNALMLSNYSPLYSSGNECEKYKFSGESGSFNVSATNLGKFKIVGITGVHADNARPVESAKSASDATGTDDGGYFEYPVSLNPTDKDFILNVLGSDPQDGDAPIYVESLYDVALRQCIADTGSTHAISINSGLTFYQVYYQADYCGLEPIAGIMEAQENSLSRKFISQRYLADYNAATSGQYLNDVAITCHPYDYSTGRPIEFSKKGSYTGLSSKKNQKKDSCGLLYHDVEVGQIYVVSQYTSNDGKRHYFYRYWLPETLPTSGALSSTSVDNVALTDSLRYGKSIHKTSDIQNRMVIVKNLQDGLYWRLTDSGKTDVTYVNCDLNNYKSAYRYASTPWIVSNLKGDYKKIEINKLFRFHTISDGNSSNNEIKVSIENIRPDDGVFDVVVRRIDDTDEYQIPLEKFSRCSLVPGTRNYISYKIGSYDGMYESKSKYITVEVNESSITESSAPAGFLGYPQIMFGGTQVVDDSASGITSPILRYNLYYDNDVKNRKQYFGLSSRVGVDVDAFTFKGDAAYINEPGMLSNGFHLDSRLNLDGYPSGETPTITVDGETGYTFDAVSQNNRTSLLIEEPIIGTEAAMSGSIYEYVNLRKFTIYFYGGFDGWDVYRDERTNTDDFKASKYLGSYDSNSGEGYSFNRIDDPELLGLNQNGITSDWYAYLAGIRQFSNPEAVDINVFATPGIDYVNNKTLVEETIEMLEEERADSIYVVTTPDKPSGAEDYVDEMYTPDDAVYNLEDSELDSNYTCTYYPWVKYLDVDNNQYIYLPPTKDVVRNFAQTDNTTYPWFAPAGLDRGDVNCVRAHIITKVGEEDTLYEGRINPVKTFATDGVKIWGQKNLQVAESQLNRIAVRRLLLRMRKLIAIACRSLIFEPNDTVTKNQFLTTVTPILDNIRSNRGISNYKIEVNDTIESRERRELPAKIYFKPFNALEYVVLDFILTPEGVDFSNI